MSTHVLPPAMFDQLAEGRAGMDGVLQAGQRSKRLLLLHELVTTARARVPGLFAEADGDTAVRLLTDAQRSARHRADEVLMQPHVGAWATHCLHDLLARGALTAVDLGHLGAVSAAAALRSGLAWEVSAHARNGSIMFPTFGLARAPIDDGWCRVRARRGSLGVEIAAGNGAHDVPFGPGPAATWTPLRRLRATSEALTFDVALDDLDPYRGDGDLPVSSRLDEGAVERWRQTADDGWSILVGAHRPVAEAIVTAVVSVVPLTSTPDAPDLSGTRFEALGAVALTEPRSPLDLALALNHELQHQKLSALLDLVQLIRLTTDELFYAPWRKDPRPLPGLLQGTYAWLGVAAFWETHLSQALASDARAAAEFELALARRQVRQGLDTLARSGRLTPAGRRFVGSMRCRLDDLDRTPVSTGAQALADLAYLDHAISWRLRNLHAAPDAVAFWVDAWLAGRPLRWADAPRPTVRDGEGTLPSDARLRLIRRRLTDPIGWQVESSTTNGRPADVALVAGETSCAAEAYRNLMVRDPSDLGSWAGLAVASKSKPTAASWALRRHPEIVAALHREIVARCGTAPEVEHLADWVGRGAR
jgi:HEXXH motif-containing protein